MTKAKIPAKKVQALYAYQQLPITYFNTENTNRGDPTTTCTTVITTTHIFKR